MSIKKVFLALLILGLIAAASVFWFVSQFEWGPEDEEEEITLAELLGGFTSASPRLVAKQAKELAAEEDPGCSSHQDCSGDQKCYGVPGGAAYCRAEVPTCSEFCGETVTCHFRGEDPIRLVCD